MVTALLLIDFQRDFIQANGKMPVDQKQVESLLISANTAVRQARAEGALIIRIGNEFKRADPINIFRRFAAVEGSPGAMWDGRVSAQDSVYFPKWRGDAFCNPRLWEFLKQHAVQEVTLAGVYAGACVTATAKGALRRGLAVNVPALAVADASEHKRNKALMRLKRLGVTVLDNAGEPR
jgi:nicotinamidase-related amidase